MVLVRPQILYTGKTTHCKENHLEILSLLSASITVQHQMVIDLVFGH